MTQTTDRRIATIFCAVDFSKTSDHALAHAKALALAHGARLVLGHVVEPLPVGPYPLLAVPAEGELAVRELAAEKLRQLAESLQAGGLDVERKLAGGAPGYELIVLAEEAGADLFVIGTRGLTGFEHLVFGSTAEHIVRCSKCPVLTVHPNDPDPGASVETVLVPTDLSESAAEATESFMQIFDGVARPRVLLVFVDQTPPYLEPFQHATFERWNEPDLRKADIEERMAPSVAKLRAAGFEVESSVIDGTPVRAITAMARDRRVDMIVMSTHGRSALLNVLLGRTAQRVVHHAPCPVLTVRPEAHASHAARD